MGRISEWDWETGEKIVVKDFSPLQGHQWQEEPYVSPDGETVAAVVNKGELDFSIRTNDTLWDVSYERIWQPKFSPDGKLTALCQEMGESSFVVDGQSVFGPCEYVWETKINKDGSGIGAMVKVDNQYGVLLNGNAWETFYENTNQYALSENGKHSVAVVQVKNLPQADIEGFKAGIYSVAVDGTAWKNRFLNVWTPTFDNDGLRVAAQVRVSTFDYTICVDDEIWPTTYNQVWEPVFHPEGKYVVAPVRVAGKWGVARDGILSWKPRYLQCLELQFSPDGANLWAIVATSYGKFTAACNDIPWATTFPVVNDLVVSPDGKRAGVLCSNYNTDFRIMVDNKVWDGTWDMAWPVTFSPDGNNVGALVEKDKRHHILINGKPFSKTFDRAWAPVFSEDSSKVMIRAIENNQYIRIVADVAQL
jgi:hypothetical protein